MARLHIGFLAAMIGFGFAQASRVVAAQESVDDGEQGDEIPTPAEGEDSVEAEAGPEGGAELESPRGDDPGRSRVAVLVLAVGNVDHTTADALTELVIGSVARRGGISIVGKEEFQALLNQEEARSVECVSSTACLGRIGVELGVDELVAGTVGRRGSTWIFNLNRIDIRSGQVAGRAFREVDGDVGALADAIQSAVPELYAAPQQPAALVITSNVEGAEIFVDGTLVGVYRGEPLTLERIPAGRHDVVVSAAGHYDWARTVTVAEGTTLQIEASLESPQPAAGGPTISPLVAIGTVGAALGLAAGIGFGAASQGDPDDGLTRSEALDHIDARRTEATVANLGFGLAAASAVTVVLGLLLSDWSAEVEVSSSGARATVGGRF